LVGLTTGDGEVELVGSNFANARDPLSTASRGHCDNKTTQRSACTTDSTHQERSIARSFNVHHNPLEIPFRLGMSTSKYQKSTGTIMPGLPLHSRACSSADVYCTSAETWLANGAMRGVMEE